MLQNPAFLKIGDKFLTKGKVITVFEKGNVYAGIGFIKGTIEGIDPSEICYFEYDKKTKVTII